MRAAESHRHAEALRRADSDVGAVLAGRGQKRQREEVGGDDGETALLLHAGDDRGGIPHATGCGRVLHEGPERLRQVGRVGLGERQVGEVEPERFRPPVEHGARLREEVGIHQEKIRRALRCPAGEEHALDDGRGLVEHRRIGGVQPREVGDHGLEVQQCLEAPL